MRATQWQTEVTFKQRGLLGCLYIKLCRKPKNEQPMACTEGSLDIRPLTSMY